MGERLRLVIELAGAGLLVVGLCTFHVGFGLMAAGGALIAVANLYPTGGDDAGSDQRDS